ncbi:lytic transglycosylase domain-containing protein [Noviherbaspirillum sp. UKPF54]|uniref:lytic transglycosylase domain-containing protein n=1 Tax=Noviherbaspirillum sp. UKPF54 TaxID=2601898 RepID=UPI0011B14C5A|nr:lytic transglycosylase domain-containing protein [Noviherbaspirillum sp. UKPF54]QDZ27271.1 lytic transglycosylase domain-containing protein [Noviherbaspirillum sp. UKPF54]
MLNRCIRVTFDFTRRKASQSAAWAVFAGDTLRGFVTTAHHTLMILGIIAIAALGAMFVKPELADQLLALSPFIEADAAEAENTVATAESAETPAPATAPIKASSEDDSKLLANSRQQQWVTSWLSKRYRVASDATHMLVSTAYMTAKDIKLDPLLILSVMAIESGFNPFAESPVGAQGLMQVMSKVHHDKFQELGGVKAALNPAANIRVGSLILKDYVTRGGSIEAGLKLYVGAGAFDSDSGYGARVLAEYRRLKDVSMGKKVPVSTAAVKPRQPEIKPNGNADEPTSVSASKESFTKEGKLAAL